MRRPFAYLAGAVCLGLLFYFGGAVLAPGLIALVSLTFLLGVPIGIGYWTVRGIGARNRVTAALLASLPIVVIVLMLWLTSWEGVICIVLALPLLLLGAITGGIGAHGRARAEKQGGPVELGVVMLLPILLMPLEQLIPERDRVAESSASIVIAAPTERVWDEIADVDTIRAGERGRALYTSIGFPAPLAATLDFPQEGGIRIASFEGGIEFVETITDWEPERRLSFAIDPRTSDAPAAPAALDAHVSIGGRYFDVLSGTYLLESDGTTGSRLTLISAHRVTTRLNLYAGWWADRVMLSVQRNILAVIKARSEDAARPPKPAIRASTAARATRLIASPREADSRTTGFSVVGSLPGRTDVYPDSVVVLVREGELLTQNLVGGPQVLDSITASLANGGNGFWNPGSPSNALIIEWPGVAGERRQLGPMLRFTIPRPLGESLEGRWVVFTHHLTVPKTEGNPSGLAWTYTHAKRADVRAP